MSILNPFEPLINKSWLRKLSLWERIFLIIWIFPAVCALLIFPLIPNYFEAMSYKASGLLDVIELGRSRPWVVFTGLPYPATLRLFGDISSVVAVLLVLMILIHPTSLVLTKKSENWKERIKNPNSSYWCGSLGYCLFIICIFLYIGVVHFILPALITIAYPLQFAWHVLLVSGVPWCTIDLFFLIGYILYSRLFVV